MTVIRNKEVKGYQEIVGKDNGKLNLLTFALLHLGADERYEGQTGDEEKVLVLLEGTMQVTVNQQVFSGSREHVFAGKATAVYVPAKTNYQVRVMTTTRIAVCGTPSQEVFAPFMVGPDDVESRVVGKEAWQREVHDIIVKNAQGKVHRIIVGETFNAAGKWSSFPPHKHDDYIPQVEAQMEEIYYYQLNPKEGFGLQAQYTLDGSVDQAFRVQHGDTFLIDKGYHPVCAAGGYQLYYLWMMAGSQDRVMIPHDDPSHQWVKA
nr:5-deoxy-glucuronate isomerase [Bacilli bacterium]